MAADRAAIQINERCVANAGRSAGSRGSGFDTAIVVACDLPGAPASWPLADPASPVALLVVAAAALAGAFWPRAGSIATPDPAALATEGATVVPLSGLPGVTRPLELPVLALVVLTLLLCILLRLFCSRSGAHHSQEPESCEVAPYLVGILDRRPLARSDVISALVVAHALFCPRLCRALDLRKRLGPGFNVLSPATRTFAQVVA